MPPDIDVRPWTLEDAGPLTAAVSESLEHLRPWMPWAADEPLALPARRAMIERWATPTGRDRSYGIFETGRVVGACGLHDRIGPQGLTIGYWVHPAHTRRGIATAAAARLTTTAFDQAGVDHVEIHHDVANVASAGVPRALGYALVDEIDEPVEAPGETGRTSVWRIGRADWLPRGAR